PRSTPSSIPAISPSFAWASAHGSHSMHSTRGSPNTKPALTHRITASREGNAMRRPDLPQYRFVTVPSEDQLLHRLEAEHEQGWAAVGVIQKPNGGFGVLLKDFWEVDSDFD